MLIQVKIIYSQKVVINSRKSKLKRIFIGLLLVFVGCTPTATPTPTAEATPEMTEVVAQNPINRICLVTDIGKIDDNTFNQYAYEGMVALEDDFPDAETSFVETEDPENYGANIQTCLDREADIVVTVGFALTEATSEAAQNTPDVYFIGVDQNVAAMDNAPENYVGIQAAEDEAGFLVGVIAATVANDIGGEVVGGVYGLDFPAVKRFRNGYEQGVLYINPDWVIGENILGSYTDSFLDTEQGAAIARDFIGQGAVVIFGAGGLTGTGAITEATSQGIFGIGVDQDQYFTTYEGGTVEGAEYLITSAVKRVDRGVLDVATLLFAGRETEFPSGDNYLLNVISNGVGFAPSHDADITDDAFAAANEAFTSLLNGDISTGVDPITGDLMVTDEATREPEN